MHHRRLVHFGVQLAQRVEQAVDRDGGSAHAPKAGGPGNGDPACGPEPAALCAAIHHPNTDEKRITFVETNTATTGYNNPVSPGAGTHVHAYWDPTPIFPPNPGQAIPPQVTEPGSSGSPLYNAARRFLGPLHRGPSYCRPTGQSLPDAAGPATIAHATTLGEPVSSGPSAPGTLPGQIVLCHRGGPARSGTRRSPAPALPLPRR